MEGESKGPSYPALFMMVAVGGTILEDHVRLATFCGPFPSAPPVVSPMIRAEKSTSCKDILQAKHWDLPFIYFIADEKY